MDNISVKQHPPILSHPKKKKDGSSNKGDMPYQPVHPIRVVTATSLFDGHDASINIMRRIMQSTGCEVIHLGHDRSAEDVAHTAIQEDAQAIALTSYQGGHNEYFKYVYDLLQERGAGHIKIFGGGGGVILPEEVHELTAHGITRIYTPEDGRKMGLQGMINDLVRQSDFPLGNKLINKISALDTSQHMSIARLISAAENFYGEHTKTLASIHQMALLSKVPVVGITGTGGSGKSSLTDEIVRRFLMDFRDNTIGILSIDPSRKKSGGALLGDRIRMNAVPHPRVFMRSMATRKSNVALSKHIKDAIAILKAARYDLIIVETSGIGQGNSEILDFSDIAIYVMTPEYGAPTQLEKIDMLDFADLVALNKSDRQGAKDALKDIQKQYQRNHGLWEEKTEYMPIFETIASQYNNAGINQLYYQLIKKIENKSLKSWKLNTSNYPTAKKDTPIIPPQQLHYLSKIARESRKYNKWVEEQANIAQQLYALQHTIDTLQKTSQPDSDIVSVLRSLKKQYQHIRTKLDNANEVLLKQWSKEKKAYKADNYSFEVRNKTLHIATQITSLSNTKISKVALPRYNAWGDLLHWLLLENMPGKFPYTSGIYSFKREGEDPTRMFAGEGGPERTNYRFHYLSKSTPAKRLSTAFDSVTLYGNDPDYRPDIYGKIGNAGVSICCIDDVKKLYSGFNLADVKTSVSMTINGPAPILLAYYMNAAIDQQCELYIRSHGMLSDVKQKIASHYTDIECPSYQRALPQGNDGLGLLLLGVTGDEVLSREMYEKIKTDTLTQVRGTVQADILKEDQAQNTCIFSIKFALQLMGDVQAYFIKNNVRNFYSVSISGYHIAEAGANPITQLAFTLANGFTYVEYYLSRGMHIDEFAPNLSFFFSNGIEPEYAVIGRVARRIWAKAMKYKYNANTRSQMLKYHIQTSGRSLHAQEIDFNDIRTTLQALYAIYDNCNSLHTNSYDEAITTPTKESVRRAMAIQLIINKELGLAKNENPLQGSFIIEELTDLVEEAVLVEFDRISDRGGVLGGMETMYQRSKIQEESMHYEMLKHKGDYPIVGVNTFLNTQESSTIIPTEVIRSNTEEKEHQIRSLQRLKKTHRTKASQKLVSIQKAALHNQNLFEELMEACKVCSLGQITNALFDIGGKYRRSM